MALSDLKIQYQNGPFWVAKTPTGYEVNRNEGTHSVRCAVIGFKGENGLKRAIAEADRRAAAQSN